MNDEVLQQVFQTLKGGNLSHLNLNKCKEALVGSIGGTIDEVVQVPIALNVAQNIGQLNTLTTLLLSGTAVTDSSILGNFA